MKPLALIAAATVVVSGCGSSHPSSSRSGPPTHHPYPVVIHSPLVLPTPRARPTGDVPKLVSPTRLALVTDGSSSCPQVPSELIVLDRHTIRIRLARGAERHGRLVPAKGLIICTTNIAPTSMLVAIDPKLIDVHHPLTVLGLPSGAVTVAPLKS